ncbi:MAG: hypothetical protein JHC33_08360 [Ignisphaera sp.]|nr:hypothetical protein [Ignisphaera sp.]
MHRYVTYATLYCTIIALFMAPILKEFSDALTSLSIYGLAMYWVLLTIISIILSLYILSKELRVMRK